MRPRLEKDLVPGLGRGQYQPPAVPPPAYQQGPQPFYYGDSEYYEGYQPEPAYETPAVVAQGPTGGPDDEQSEFGGLVSYFSSQREDDLES